MRDQPTAAPTPLRISSTGVLVLNGYGTSLRVKRGMLSVRTVIDGRAVEGLIPKVSEPRLRRLVIIGRGGYVTFDVFAWLDGIGASYVHLASDGHELSTSSFPGPDQPALRRAQAMATSNGTDLAVARYLLGLKVAGQRDVLRSGFGERTDELRLLDQAVGGDR
jgi:hypothetical protein